MSHELTSWHEPLNEQAVLLGATQCDIARAAGISQGTVSNTLTGKRSSAPLAKAICRGLMLLAWERGWDDDAVWALNEHSLLGMQPPLDRQRVLAEIRERAEERAELRRAQRSRQRGEQESAA